MPRLVLALFLSILPVLGQNLPILTDGIYAAAVDSDGFIYVMGGDYFGQLPVTPGAFQPSRPANCPPLSCTPGYVAKVAPSGNLVWATYFYSAPFGMVTKIAVGKDGSVYVARSAPSNETIPTFGGFQSTPANIFIAKLSSDGKSILAATYLGGAGDTIAALQLDESGNVYVAGTARSAGFPTTPGAYQRQPGTDPPVTCGSSEPPSAQFVAKFDSSLKTLVFSTLVGRARRQTTDAFAIGPDGSLYLTGTINRPRGPCWDAAITRLSRDGSTAIYSNTLELGNSFYGGYAIAVDSDGSAYVGGDNRPFFGYDGVIRKYDPLGVLISEQRIGGLIGQLAISGKELVLTGQALGYTLATSPNSPPACSEKGYRFSTAPFIARWSLPSMKIVYLGYLPARGLQLAGPEAVLALYAYTRQVPLSVVPLGAPQPGTVTCVDNAATYYGYSNNGIDVAPGEIITIFGNQIGPPSPVSAALDGTGNVSSQLAGIEILVGGLPAPILYAAPDQINLVIPFGLAADAMPSFELRRNGAVVSKFPVQVLPQHMGLFTLDNTGTGQLAALNQDGSVNSPENPAPLGSTVVVFGTGLGAMTPLPVDGSRSPQAVSRPVSTFQATVSGVDAVIEYIGNAPTLVAGLVQINVRLPNQLPASGPPGMAGIGIFTGANIRGGFGYIAIR